MIREFTQEAKNELMLEISAVLLGGLNVTLRDSLAYSGVDLASSMGSVSLENCINDVDSYYTKLQEANDTSRTEIENIFQTVSNIDFNYAGKLAELNSNLKETVNYVKELSGIVSYGKEVGLENVVVDLEEVLDDAERMKMGLYIAMSDMGFISELTEEQIEQIKVYLEKEVEELGRDIIVLNDDDLKERQELVVDLYRMLDSEAAEKFDVLFDSGSEPISHFDRYNIMYIVYTAEEPYRSLFLNSLGTYSLGDVNLEDRSFYTVSGSTEVSEFASANTVNLNKNAMYNCIKGPYVSFFHECAHAMDYQANGSGFYSNSYMNGTNYNVIYNDVYSYIETETYEYCVDNSIGDSAGGREIIVENVLYSIKNNGDDSMLSDEEKEVFDNVKIKLRLELCERSNLYLTENSDGKMVASQARAGASDMYGGITNNIIKGDSTHDDRDIDDVDGDNNTLEYTYGYSIDGEIEPTGSHEKEMWAHYYSYGIVGHQDAIDAMGDVFLINTMDRYDQMAEDMKNEF